MRTAMLTPAFRLPERDLEDIRAHHDRLVARHPEYRDYCPNLLAHDLAFLNWARVPEILDMVEQVIGPDIAPLELQLLPPSRR